VKLSLNRASLESAESNFTRATNSFKRKQQLHEDGLLSREDYELAQSEAKSAKSQLEMAQAQVSQMETAVKVARITSSRSGTATTLPSAA
jgi:multidrug resistance efflux pump